MSEQLSSSARTDDDAPSSPKRKKVRQKYAPKACVSCRRSKLKCSGENPCQRCFDNAKRCFYSEDQTAAEALQNLSRPPPVQTPSNTNGNGPPRRNILPRQDSIERRTSDASLSGISMEARMSRIENMMEALVQERGAALASRGSMDRDEMVIDDFPRQTATQPKVEAPCGVGVSSQPSAIELEPPYSGSRMEQSISIAREPAGVGTTSTIQLATRSLIFPSPAQYQRYIDQFFAIVNPYLPCVNEVEFRLRGEKILAAESRDEDSFLVLNYIIFACVDVSVNNSHVRIYCKPPGWKWFKTAEELSACMRHSGNEDLTFIQYLVLEALYFTLWDRPDPAYSTIGLACRLCFQCGLHQQSYWECSPSEIHMRQRIFWCIYVTDRRTALSCGRPYGIRDADIEVEYPAWINDKILKPEHPLPQPDPPQSINIYLYCLIHWAKFAGDAWDQLFSRPISKHGLNQQSAAILDARITHWMESVLPTIPLPSPDRESSLWNFEQFAVIHARFSHLRLLLLRPAMLSLEYDGRTGELAGSLALDIIQQMAHQNLRHYPVCSNTVASLSAAMLTLATLLTRDLSSIGLLDARAGYIKHFIEGNQKLDSLAFYFQPARRLADDLNAIIKMVMAMYDVQWGRYKDSTYTLPEPGYQPVPLANVRKLLPWTSLVFVQQPLRATAKAGEGFAFNFREYDPAKGIFCERGTEVELSERGYGVPWV